MARNNSEALVKQSADRLANIMLRSTRYGMLHNDRDALINIIQELGSEPGIQRIRIFNQDGRLTLSTDPREVNAHCRASPAAAGSRSHFPRSPGPARARGDPAHRELADLFQCRVPRSSGVPADSRDDRRRSFAGPGGRPDGAAPGRAALVPGGGNRIRLPGGRGVHVGVRLPAGERTDSRHAPRGRMAISSTACRSAPTTSWEISPRRSTR